MKTSKRKSPELIDESLAGSLAAGLRPVEPGPSRRSRLRRRIVERVLDPAPAGTFTLRATDRGWSALNDRVATRVLRRDVARGDQTILIRMLPGAVIDAHSHAMEEECYVIDGEVEIGKHRLRRGDAHVAAPGARHDPIHSPTGALLLVRGEIPAKSARLA